MEIEETSPLDLLNPDPLEELQITLDSFITAEYSREESKF